ncbi:MAG: DUF3801 domain-containing protein [Oscillospiraceae bacterium]|nr:DUF3801 domain-containing protein [Oscillospiraceae bacterium]
MNYSGDAAEQIVKILIDGTESAIRITGAAAKGIALIIIAALKKGDKEQLKLKGEARLTSMLKSGKPLEIHSIKERDVRKFADGAKEYGIVYSMLRNTKNTPDGLCDVMIKADDAPKFTRLTERYDFATVDRAKIESEIVNSRSEKSEASKGTVTETSKDTTKGSEPEAMDVADTEKLLDDLLGTSEGKVEPNNPEPEKANTQQVSQTKQEPDKPEAEVKDNRPLVTDSNSSPTQSEHTSEPNKNSERATLTNPKPSVKKEMREIQTSQKARDKEKVKRNTRTASEKPKNNPATTHQQPQNSGRKKSPKMKGSR